MPEDISAIGCTFKVFRKRKKRKVISISIWKANIGYVFNISNAILWWARYSEILFPGWNVRFYVDYSIFRKKYGIEDVDWDEILLQARKHPNIELWFYSCSWGLDPENLLQTSHIGTFGSLVRFHALTDPNIKIAVFKNVELLSSVKDARIIHDWVASHKKYHVIYTPSYFCNYNNRLLCRETGMRKTNMFLATCGVRGGIPDFFTQINYFLPKSTQLSKYVYGVDEVLLTKIVKPRLSEDNTYLTLRDVSNQTWPIDNPNYNHFFSLIFNYLNDWDNYTVEEIRVISLIYPLKTQEYDRYIIPGEQYHPRWNRQIMIEVGEIAKKAPDIIVGLFKYLLRVLKPKINLTHIYQAIQSYYLKAFLNNDKVTASSFISNATSEEEADILAYVCIRTVIFEDIDWPGYILKSKRGSLKRQKYTEKDLEKARNAIINFYRVLRKPLPSEEDLEKETKKELERNLITREEEFERNQQIYNRNIKNTYLFSDTEYE